MSVIEFKFHIFLDEAYLPFPVSIETCISFYPLNLSGNCFSFIDFSFPTESQLFVITFEFTDPSLQLLAFPHQNIIMLFYSGVFLVYIGFGLIFLLVAFHQNH